MDICVLDLWKEKWKHVEWSTQDPPATRCYSLTSRGPWESGLHYCHVALLQTLPVGLDFGYLQRAEEQPLLQKTAAASFLMHKFLWSGSWKRVTRHGFCFLDWDFSCELRPSSRCFLYGMIREQYLAEPMGYTVQVAWFLYNFLAPEFFCGRPGFHRRMF